MEVEPCNLHGHGEQQMPDRALQVEMLHDCIKNRVTPGVMVLLTGDGAGYARGKGFQVTLESVHSMGWSVSWVNNCNRRLQRWVEGHGRVYALDNFYWAITFLEASKSSRYTAAYRPSQCVDLKLKGHSTTTALTKSSTHSLPSSSHSLPQQEDWDAEELEQKESRIETHTPLTAISLFLYTSYSLFLIIVSVHLLYYSLIIIDLASCEIFVCMRSL